MFLKFFKTRTIGVTGTKGKSTTATLMYHMLKTSNKRAELIGNIGFPAFDFLEKEENVDYFVYELSAHQLENCKYSPKISIFLNIYEEHLDHFKTFEKYLMAKQNIFKNQTNQDICLYNFEMKESLIGNLNINSKLVPITFSNTKEFSKDYTNINKYKITSYLNDNKITFNFPYKESKLKGNHNINNFMFVLTVANYLNIDKKIINQSILSFETLEHRMQDIGIYNNVRYINDSISTIPEATISAIETIKGVETVLIGGMDRGINYNGFMDYFKNSEVKNIILMYETGKKIKELLKDIKNKNIIYVEELEDAVKLSVNITSKNKTCLLSPAAASYGHFLNFEERGKAFKRYVEKYNQ